MLELEIENKYTVILINLYGPNADSPHFYTEINDIISASLNEFTIICGDYNLIQDSKLDYYNYSTINNPKARIELLKLKQENNLVDPWRIHNPDVSTFTWFRKNPVKKSSLDFFLISEELLSLTENVNIRPGYRTDHSIVELELRLSDFIKGKGFWKFNNALLRDNTDIEKVENTISSVIEKYAAPIYNFTDINIIPNTYRTH